MRAIDHTTRQIPRQLAPAGGFTLVEATVAMVVVALASCGVIGLLGSSYQASSMLRQRATAVSLARQLIEEIAARPYADPTTGLTSTGPAAGETTRASYTDVGNYNGYHDTTSTLTALDGSSPAVGSEEIYSRSVAVTYGTKPSIDTASPSADFAAVSVTVTAPSGQKIMLSRVCANYSVVR